MTYEGLEGLSEFIEGDFGQVSVPWRQGGTQKNKGKGSLEMGMSLGGLAHAPATQAVCVLMSGKYSFLTLALHRFCFTKKPGIIYFPSPYKKRCQLRAVHKHGVLFTVLDPNSRPEE